MSIDQLKKNHFSRLMHLQKDFENLKSQSNANANGESSKIRIYVGTHDYFFIPESDIICPMQLGSYNSHVHTGYLRDDTGIHISPLNKVLNEMTAFYWIWKNSDSDVVGFFHYRRYLSMHDTSEKCDMYGLRYLDNITDSTTKLWGLESQTISSLLNSYDIILPQSWDVRNGNTGANSLWQHYELAAPNILFISDLDLVINVMLNFYPDYKTITDEVLDRNQAWFTNILICRKQLFDEYCSWVFPVLFESLRLIDLSGRSPMQKRAVAFASEWLFNIFFEKRIRDGQLRIFEAPRYFIRNDSPLTCKNNYFIGLKENVACEEIPVVYCTDASWAVYATASINSLISNRCSNTMICVYLVYTGILDEDIINYCDSLIAASSNCRICYIKIPNYFHNINDNGVLAPAAFLRLALGEVLPNINKCIYIDVDTIVLCDIKSLFQTQLFDSPLAAVPCSEIYIQRKQNIPAHSDYFDGTINQYLQDYLNILPDGKYFNSGVMLMNLDLFRRAGVLRESLNILKSRQFWYMDQDILNMFFSESYLKLPSHWNYQISTPSECCFIDGFDNFLNNIMLNGHKNISIIHYSGRHRKPWKDPNSHLSHAFYKFMPQGLMCGRWSKYFNIEKKISL